MLKPVAASITAKTASWNQLTPKYHRYNGTAVSVRTNVPIRNELVVQLMRSVGIRKIKRENSWEGIVGSLISAENDILFCPGMHAAAVRTGKLLRFQFHCWPGFFFDCPASIGQLRRRRTAHQQAFDIGPGFYFRASRRIKQESGRHIRVGKRYELSRCRKATSPFSLDHQS